MASDTRSRQKGPERITTARLLLRKPVASDAQAIFDRYASDPVVTRYMSWPTHRSLADTEAFLAWSDADWDAWPAGSYLVFCRLTGSLLGGTGLAFRTLRHAATGYVFARDAWGLGYATESVIAMLDLARSLGLESLEAACHAEHRASAHVLEKAGFLPHSDPAEGVAFPNLVPAARSAVLRFVRQFR